MGSYEAMTYNLKKVQKNHPEIQFFTIFDNFWTYGTRFEGLGELFLAQTFNLSHPRAFRS